MQEQDQETIKKDSSVEQPKEKTYTFTEKQLEERDQRVGQSSYEEGKKVGREKTIRTMKDMVGIEVEGRDEKTFIDAFREHILTDAKVEPSKKIQSLEEQNAGLLKNLEAIKSEYQQKETTLTQQVKKMKYDHLIESNIPDNIPGGLTKTDARLLFENYYKLSETEDGELNVYRDGKVLSDPITMKPVGIDSAVQMFLSEKNLMATDKQGRGENNSLSKPDMSHKKIVDAGTFQNYLRENNIGFTSPQAMEIYGKLDQDVRQKISQDRG